MGLFWKIVDKLDADGSQAQIVVGLPGGDRKDGHGGQPIEAVARELLACLRNSEKSEAVLVIATDTQSCQETVMRLGEMGVRQLHAIHPKRNDARQPAEPASPKTDR